MATVKPTTCASCGLSVVWLRSFGFGDIRPVELAVSDDGDVVVDLEEARYRYPSPGEVTALHRHRLHWPCGAARAPATVDATIPTTTAGPARPLRVAVVSHVHWDREWYVPFEAFRARLTDVVDEVLDRLDADPTFTSFHLDGQTAMVDDYLDVRPGAEDRVRRLVAAGRLSVGPWETLADEFLVSGETLVRNLQRGMRRARQLGGVSAVGYLPDQFGHAAQLPQILTLAGISQVVVFRGVPCSIAETGFWWEAPDGSRVRAERLPAGYCHAFRFEDDAKRLVDRARDFETMLGAARVGGLLLMNGCDHQPLKPWVPAVIAGANELQDDYRFVLGRLDDHLAAQPADGLPTWRGELRDTGIATVTPGVISNRMDVRLATAAAERAVERWAEPLSALYLPSHRWPGGLLDRAWSLLVRNAAHDSICACSADEVVRAVLVRADGARRIGEHVSAKAVERLAEDVEVGFASAPTSARAVVVVNPTARLRRGVVEARVAGEGPCHLVSVDGEPLATQELGGDDVVELEITAAGGDLDAVLDLTGPDRFAGHQVAAWTEDTRTDPSFRLVMAGEGEPAADLTRLVSRITAWRAEHPADPARVVLVHPPVRRLLASTGPVRGFGWHAHRVVEGTGPETAVRAGATWIANEHLHVEVDPDDGTLAVTTADGLAASGLARLVDGGDAGDVYNWSPPTADTLVEAPSHVRIETLERGPVRAGLAVTRTYRWPVAVERVDGRSRRSDAREDVDVTFRVELVVGERCVRLTVEFDNRCRDHRLRLHLPLPATVSGSEAECAFAVVHRGLTANGNPMEAALPTFPSRRFVDFSDGRFGLAVVHDGCGEYEVVDGGREAAFTLLRATGWLSREDGSKRPFHAGPEVALHDAQLPGPYRRRLALVLHRGGWEEAELAAVADDLLVPLEAVPVRPGGRGHRAAEGSRLTVDGADVTAVSRVDGALEVRLVRLSPNPGRAGVELDGSPARGTVVGLDGAAREPFGGSVSLAAWQIVTLRLEEA